ncbi:DsbA family protein [Sphingomonas sp. 7/4-4]|uniref:DsbA family protein n=1 Tax=Sphingomonas sp. 7/4-4 TaxID=3018446 RepID=UPI0022F3EBE4|nr:DsbA family protein [Sphingomonas sp. 7/4-4]WBY06494.1 DsbA family protein [Sphingomonas sp. 7/4-4]
MTHRFIYLFDPLCGWCYGASAGVDTLASRPGVSVELLPTGLFSGAGARALDAGMTSHIWAADQRIAELTGAAFTERYRDQILAGTSLLDSGPATLALTAVSLSAPAREYEALNAIQKARYVEGRDITNPVILAEVLASLDLAGAAAMIAEPQATLLNANQERVTRARALMQRFGLNGVPALVRDDGQDLALADAGALYRNPLSLLEKAGVA